MSDDIVSRTGKELAQKMYEAYCRNSGGKSLATGDQLPGWDELPNEIKEAWRECARVSTRVILDGLSRLVASLSVELFLDAYCKNQEEESDR